MRPNFTSILTTITLAVVSSLCLLSAACGSQGTTSQSPQTPTLKSLAISAESSSIPEGATYPLTVIGTYSDGSSATLTDKVTWFSSDNSIAAVNAAGQVTGVAKGNVVITASTKSLSSTISLSVGDAVLSRIDITPPAPSLPANTALQLVAIGTFSNGTSRDVSDLVTWSGSDSSRLVVSSIGRVTGIGSGTTTVTAKAGAISASVSVKVTTSQLVRMAVLPYQPVTGVGVIQRFSALGTFDDYTTSELVSVSWNSSDSTVAQVSSGGTATPLKSGATTITATAGAIQGSVVLTVLPATLSSISIDPATAVIAVGTDQKLVARGLLSDGSIVDLPEVTWSSNDDSMASVDTFGMSSGVAPGTVTVSATVGAVKGSSTLKVTDATLDLIVVAPGEPIVPILALKQLHAVGKFSDGSVQDITTAVDWWSSNSNMVTVNRLGLSSTSSKGEATISATLGNVRGSTALHISSVTVDSLEVTPAAATLPEGARLQYSLLSHLSDGTTAALDAPSWLTSPITMATVTPTGLVTARSPAIGKVYGETCCEMSFTQLTVSNAQATGLTIDANDTSIPVGAIQPLHALATFSDRSVVDVSDAVHWASSDPTVADIDATGTVAAHAQGETTVTAVFGPVAGSAQTVATTATVTVVAGNLSSLAISPANASFSLGEAESLTVLGTFSDASTHAVPEVTWKSSDPSVAIVLPTGLVISTGRGSTVITAMSGSVQASAGISIE